MPITSELDNRRKFKAAGFSDQQAEVLVEVIERSVQQGFEKFAEVLERSFSDLRSEMNARFTALDERIELLRAETRAEIAEVRGEIGSLRGEFQSALRDQLFKLVALIVSVVGLGVAIIKLFPDWY
jgi:hypothetical protein